MLSIASEIQRHAPDLYPFLHQAYSNAAPLFFGSDTLNSTTGIQQGDPCSPPAFALAVDQVVKSCASPLNIWYLDGGTIGGNLHTVIKDIQTAIPALADLGLEVNPKRM